MRSSRKAQAWGTDLVVASIIFIAGVIAFYLFVLNYPSQTHETISTLTFNGNAISNILLSQGQPENWKANNVIKPGIESDKKINQTKLERFYNLSTENYNLTRNLFKTNYNYYITFSNNLTINNKTIQGIGEKPENPEDIIKTSRIVILNKKIQTMYIEIWD